MSENNTGKNAESNQETERDESQLISIIGTLREAYFMEGFGLAEVDRIVGRPPCYGISDEEGSSEDVSYFCRN